MKNSILLLFISIVFWSCSNKENKIENVERAFYYWKSSSYFDDESVKGINKLKVKKIYYKLFEVDYNESMGNFPYQKNSPNEYMFRNLDSLNIVPTVFIRNEIFQYNDERSLDKLADNIVFLIDKYHKESYYNSQEKVIFEYDEIQIDCDWTKSTKDKYFYLLKKIKELSKKQISCTLRLYPYKYPDIMGVPPVDKAMLMCYNLIKPLENKTKNSILDLDELKSYLNKRRSYPLHLDVALPVFYWTQWYQNDRFSGLLNINSADMKTFTKEVKPMWYEVTKDTSYSDKNYFRIGDQIKCEEVDSKKIMEAISIIKNNVELGKNTTISLFDLGESTFKKYSNAEISSFYSSFSK
ncbi:hypothetical protein [Flavobacterium sp. SORGH_AS_0622]|uniref:hypothetical protein n=1 Tax=Flavobacterium sp. SORGH_AS_0622 TaxID=3041772 RepID=UPI002782CF51|nr:hypothetical protein [Flavobacterium sp. SORGH_AS_0622]MDQ1164862.1 hypothetical protein [Flavobacterium sp. SORGH_AS_0622]